MLKTAHLREPTGKQLIWLSFYTDESNRKTFLNGTQSSFAAFNPGSTNSARQMGVDTKKALAPYLTKWFDEEMFSEQALKNKVRSLMGSHRTKVIKVKGAVLKDDLAPGQRIICTTGVVHEHENDDGETVEVFGAGETLIAIDMEDKGIQRQSTDMAIKIKGMYAADKLDVSGLEGLAGRLTRAGQRAGDAEPVEDTEATEDDELFD